MYKLIAVDMDGTMLNDQHALTPEVIHAVREAKAAGIKIVLCTGRPLPGVQRYVDQLSLREEGDYIAVFNGALVQETFTSRVISQLDMLYEDVRELEYLSRELPIAMQYFSEKHIYTPQRDIDKYTVLDAYLNNIPLRVRTLEEVGPSVALPKVMFVGDKEDIDRTELLLPEKIKARNKIMRSTSHFLEFLHPEASKGNAVMDLAARLGIAREEVMCIGDNGNDLSMIEAAGCGVAMGNAIPEIKAAADIITSTNNENGVAEAINNVLLQSR